MNDLNQLLRKWRRDPVAFIGEVLRNPEDGRPFALYPAEAEFLRRTLTPAPGRSSMFYV